MAPIRSLRIAVVEDHVLLRTVLAAVVGKWPHGKVVLEAEHGQDYCAQVQQVGPIDLVIVDLLVPVMDGFDTIAWIREEQPDARILAITFDPQDAYVHRALLAGAHGVVGKDRILDRSPEKGIRPMPTEGRTGPKALDRGWRCCWDPTSGITQSVNPTPDGLGE